MNMTLERIILQGVLKYLARTFGPVVSEAATENGATNSVLTPKFVSTSDKWHVLKQIQSQSGTFQYPYLFLRLTSVEIPQSSESYNPKALLRSGMYSAPDDSLTTVNRHRLIPVKMQCEVSFITDDFWQSMAFTNAWMFGALRKDLNFNVTFDGIKVSVQVLMETTLNTPDKDSAVDVPNAYEMIGTLTIQGYFSENKPLTDVEKYTIF